MKKIWINIKDNCIAIFYVCFGLTFVICFIIGLTKLGHNNDNIDIPTPVEKEIIDTLYITRDSLIYVTQYLDSIKHDTIEKVYKLDDTSTLDLFYKLVSE